MTPPKSLEEQLQEKYAELIKTASTMTVTEFSKHVDVPITLWGKPSTYSCVKVGNTSYLWKLSDGKFDGYDTVIVENIQQ